MKDYKKLLMENSYRLTLEEFKTIPIVEFLNNNKALDWLFYYEKNDIVQYCLETLPYKTIIKEKNYINDYCTSITLEKTNTILLDYLLEKKLITKQKIWECIDYFLLGNNNIKYLPEIINKEDVVLLGNKAVYYVNDIILNYAIKQGFHRKELKIENFLFCVKNHVNINTKRKVLKIIDKKFDVNIDIKILDEIEKDRNILSSDHQCMKEVFDIIFKSIDVKNLCEYYPKIILEIIKAESLIDSSIIKNKILIEHINDFSQESLQKIKNFNKHFYREIEKMKLYQNLLNNEKPKVSISSIKKIKI